MELMLLKYIRNIDGSQKDPLAPLKGELPAKNYGRDNYCRRYVALPNVV
jgi:hypothetical protein